MSLYQIQAGFDDDGARAKIRRLRASQPRHERSALAGAAMLGTALASWGAALWMLMA